MEDLTNLKLHLKNFKYLKIATSFMISLSGYRFDNFEEV